jgi:hypothetical protein
MKSLSLILCAFLFLFFISCHKTGSSNSNSSAYYLSSVTNVSPQQKVVDSFTYDSSHRLARFAQYAYDSTSGTPQASYWTADFALPANGSAAPASYTFTINSTQDIHTLSYDGQGRITKDTSLSGSGFVTYYSYPNNNIATTVLFDGTPLNNQIDTLFISNGNVSSSHTYLPNNAGTADSLEGALSFGLSSLGNPAYHAAISKSIGPLLYILQFDNYGGGLDPISANVFNSISGVESGLPSNVPIKYIPVTDSKGRLIQLSTSYGVAAGVILYNYY